jgi:hypothetical protein
VTAEAKATQLAPEHEQEWRDRDLNANLMSTHRRWVTRYKPEHKVELDTDGFPLAQDWWPQLQIKPVGATWQQLEEIALAQPQADMKPQGVN